MKYGLILLSFVASLAWSANTVDETLDAEGVKSVSIHNVRGKIDVTGAEVSQVAVKGNIDEIAEEFIFRREGDSIVIKVELPKNKRMRGHSGSSLSITVPQELKVRFDGVATDIDVKNITGGVELTTVSGNVEVNNVEPSTYLNSVSGNIKVVNARGPFEVSTVSGDLTASVKSEVIEINAISADVNVVTEQVKMLKVSNVSGDVIVKGAFLKDAQAKMSCVSGETIFEVIGELNAIVNLQTGPGGDIVNTITQDKPKVSFIQDKSLRFTAGDGNGSVKMSTVSGTIGVK